MTLPERGDWLRHYCVCYDHTDIDLSKRGGGLHFVLWLIAVSVLPLTLSGVTTVATRCCASYVRRKRFRSAAKVLPQA